MSAGRGEIWYADLNPSQGSEQGGRRPVLIVQNDAINRLTRTVVIVPFTTNIRRASLPSCVRVDRGEGGLPQESVLLGHQMRAIDTSRLTDKLGEVGPATLDELESVLLFTLDIDQANEE